MQITKAIENLKILEGGKGREADNSEVNVGIDQSSYDAFCAHRGVATKPVWTLTPEEIQNFYVMEYIAPLQCTQLPDPIGYILFAYELNTSGAGDKGRAVRDLQLLVGCSPDGIMGPETVKAVQDYPDPDKLGILLADKQIAYYKEDAKVNPDAPLVGWENRVDKTLEICGLPQREE